MFFPGDECPRCNMINTEEDTGGCVTFSKLLDLFMAQFPYLWNREIPCYIDYQKHVLSYIVWQMTISISVFIIYLVSFYCMSLVFVPPKNIWAPKKHLCFCIHCLDFRKWSSMLADTMPLLSVSSLWGLSSIPRLFNHAPVALYFWSLETRSYKAQAGHLFM